MYKFIIIVLLFLSQIVKGQDSLNLKFIPLANKTYKTKIIQELSSNGKLESAPSTSRKIEVTSSNAELGGFNSLESTMITNGERDGIIPYILKFSKVESSQKYNGETSKIDNPLDGSIIYGYFDSRTNEKKIDSIVNKNLDSLEISSLKLQLLQTQKTSKKKAIEIGSSFEEESTMVFPILGADEQKFILTTRYTLVKIEKGIGYLDTKMFFRLKSPNEKIEVLPTSNGSGTIIYDIENHYSVKDQSDFTLYVNVLTNNDLRLSSQISTKSCTTMTIEDR